MANQTMLKFGYPDTLIADYRHWCVLLRPAQATLGALVLVCKDAAEAFPDIPTTAFAELAEATAEIEGALAAFRPYDKMNYLMLMMVDPDVHFHVLPRYEAPQEFDGATYADAGWPGPPALAEAVTPDEATRGSLITAIRAGWPGGADKG